MKTHTTIGYKICMNDLKLRPYAAGALYHHEGLDGSGYPNGLVAHEIPIEAQIITVADQFDAIVSKRQYKSHIDISEALKLIIDDTKPTKRFSSDIHEKMGKLNKLVVKKLLKVVLDDIYLEISFTQDYVEQLKSDLSRFEEITKYEEKMNSTKKEDSKLYYLEGINSLFKQGENLENYKTLNKIFIILIISVSIFKITTIKKMFLSYLIHIFLNFQLSFSIIKTTYITKIILHIFRNIN